MEMPRPANHLAMHELQPPFFFTFQCSQPYKIFTAELQAGPRRTMYFEEALSPSLCFLGKKKKKEKAPSFIVFPFLFVPGWIKKLLYQTPSCADFLTMAAGYLLHQGPLKVILIKSSRVMTVISAPLGDDLYPSAAA